MGSEIMKKQIWERYSIQEMIDGLLEIGYGSGEELYDYISNYLTKEESGQLITLLRKINFCQGHM